jgi:hypothetical protein
MRWLPYIALAVSLLALGISIHTWTQADARAEAALQRREKALVDRIRPEINKLCRDFGLKELPDDVQTLEELMVPVQRLGAGLSK